MKIVFIARHYSYLRLFESAILALAERGHQIVLAADRTETMGGRQMVERIAETYPNVTTCDAPGRYTGAWAEVAQQLRLGLDYLRFLRAGLRRDALPPPARAGAGAAAGRAAGRVRRWAPWSAGVAAWRRSSVPLNAACPSRRRCGSS